MLFEMTIAAHQAYERFEVNPGIPVVMEVLLNGRAVKVLLSHSGTWIRPGREKTVDYYVCCHPQRLEPRLKGKHPFPDHVGPIRGRIFACNKKLWWEVTPA